MQAETEYPRGHMMQIMVLDGLIFLIGLALLAGPFATGFYPGDVDTTAHVALGALIALLSIFRVLVAYGSIWIDVVLIAFGIIVFQIPQIMHMKWNAHYLAGHMLAGGAIIVLSIISAVLTTVVLRKMPAPR